MTNNIWNGSIGEFALGSNWSSGKVKGDDEIDAGDATLGLATPKTVTSLLLGTAGRLTVKGVLTSGAVVNHGTIFDWGTFDASTAAFTNTGLLEIGRSLAISDDDVVTSGKSGMLKVASIDNTGVVDLEGLAQGTTPSAVLKVLGVASFGTVGVISGKVELSDSAKIQFASGSFTSIAADGKLILDGPDAVITTKGGAYSNTTLTTLASNLGTLDLSHGSSIAAAGAFTNSGAIDLEKGDESLSTSLSIGGALTNEIGGAITLGADKKLAGFDKLTITGALNNDGDLYLGSTTLQDAVTVTAASLVNASTGYISLVTALPTSSTATLDIAAAAGFGTAGVVTGSVYLQGNSTLEFASGQITTIGEYGSLTLDGANAFVADASALTSNSALNVSLIRGFLALDNGASETSSGALTVKGSLDLDYGDYSDDSVTDGGSSLTVVGALTNDGYVSIGATNLLANDTVKVASLVNDDTLDLTGTAGAGEAILSDAAVAGFGTVGAVTGTVDLVGNASIEFASGQITTVDGGAYLELDGDDSFVSDASALGSNSALTGLALVEGSLELDNGAAVTTTGPLTVSGYLDMDDFDKAKGGSSLTVTGALTNDSYYYAGGGIYVGGDDILANDTLTVASLVNYGELSLDGDPGKGEAIVNVGTAAELGTAGTITGYVFLQGNSTLEFKSGVFDTVAYDASLDLDGTDAFVADASALGSNSALNLMQVSGTLVLDDGASETSTSSLTVAGTVELDEYEYDNYSKGLGGSSLKVDGALTVDYDGNVSIGGDDILTGDTVTAASLTNYGSLDIEGGLVKGEGEALLDVATAADFGTLGTLSGYVFLSGDATVEFASGEITTIAGELTLDGDDAFVADKATLGANSALTGLTKVTGEFALDNGASLTTTGPLTVTEDLYVDYFHFYGSKGGSSLTVGGALTNSGFVAIGSDDILSNDTVTVNSLINTGTIEITGDPGKGEALLNVASAVDFEAATGTDDTLTGDVYLTGDATLEFASGEVTTIALDAELFLSGDDAFVADKSTLGANSALTGLATVDGEFGLENGATVTTNGALTVADTGDLYLDEETLKGGSSLTVGGALTNDGYIFIGSDNLGANDTLTVASVTNTTGYIELDGDPGFGEGILDVTSAAGFGTAGTVVGDVYLFGNSTVEFASGEITTIAAGAFLELNGDDAFVADLATPGANSALTGLTTITGGLELNDGASITTTGGLTVTGTGYLSLDDYGLVGGSSLTVGGALTNSGDIYLGGPEIVDDVKLTVTSLTNTGYLDLDGNPGQGETIVTVNSAAGFGTASTVTGDVYLDGASEILFSSGSITTIAAGATLSLDGDDSFIGAANGELLLTTNSGEFSLADGASLSLAGPLTNSGELYLDSEFFDYGKGGTTLTVSGTLTNSGDIYLGDYYQASDDTLAVGTLGNAGDIVVYGSATSTESITGAVTNTGGVYVESGDLKLTGAVTGAGYFEFDDPFTPSTLEFDGAVASGQTVYFDAPSSYMQTLNLGDTAGGAFAATLEDFKSATAGKQEIDLKGFVATSEAIAADVLTLTNAAAATVKLTFAGAAYTLADFTFTTTTTDTIIKNA